jgi:hypothetical protein
VLVKAPICWSLHFRLKWRSEAKSAKRSFASKKDILSEYEATNYFVTSPADFYFSEIKRPALFLTTAYFSVKAMLASKNEAGPLISEK